LRRYWSSYRNVDDLDCLRIRFETGKLVNTWVGNCIAIGLAGGFIEPLESTGLAITQMGIEMATSMIDARFYDHVTQERYNSYIAKFYADIYHFIVAHYCLTHREDTPFWAAVKHETKIPDELQQRLEVFRLNLPTTGTRGTAEPFMFRDISWFAVLLGMDFSFSPQPVEAHLSTAGRLILERKRATIRGLQAKLPNHYRFLRDSVYGHE
jgi:tryptophan 7-halogenase